VVTKSQDVLLRLYDRFNWHDFAAADELFSADAVVDCSPFQHQG
jgi:hypothetical protein